MESDKLLLRSLEELTNVAYGRPSGPLMPLIEELREYLREFTDLVPEVNANDAATKGYVDKIRAATRNSGIRNHGPSELEDLEYFNNTLTATNRIPDQYRSADINSMYPIQTQTNQPLGWNNIQQYGGEHLQENWGTGIIQAAPINTIAGFAENRLPQYVLGQLRTNPATFEIEQYNGTSWITVRE